MTHSMSFYVIPYLLLYVVETTYRYKQSCIYRRPALTVVLITRTLMSPSYKHPQFSHSSPKLLILCHHPQAYTLWVSHRVLYSSHCLCTIRHSCLSIPIMTSERSWWVSSLRDCIKSLCFPSVSTSACGSEIQASIHFLNANLAAYTFVIDVLDMCDKPDWNLYLPYRSSVTCKFLNNGTRILQLKHLLIGHQCVMPSWRFALQTPAPSSV